MNAIVETLPRVSLPRIYALESKYEFLRVLRTPSFAVPTLLFPPMFYLLFAVLFVRTRPATSTHTSICSRPTACSASWRRACSASAFASRSIASAAGLRSSARADAARCLSAGEARDGDAVRGDHLTILAVLAMTVGGVTLPLAAWLRLFVVEIFGVLPFCALGLCIGSTRQRTGSAGRRQSDLSADVVPLGLVDAADDAAAGRARNRAALAGVSPRAARALGGRAAVGRRDARARRGAAAVTIVFLAIARRRLARA